MIRLHQQALRVWGVAGVFVFAVLAAGARPAVGQGVEVSGFASAEMRWFPQSPLDPQQFEGLNFSLALQPEFFSEWDRGTQRLVFVPFLRVDQHDSRRTHFDIRELYYEKVWRWVELRFGLRKIFWGVAETNHLIDVINQVDGVENIDNEDRLGQPMVDAAFITPYGVFDVYAMPFFRERTFPGAEGRLRTIPVVDSDDPQFESGTGATHFDWAVRYSHFVGIFDFGVAHFQGTSRTPQFLFSQDSGGNAVLLPFYEQMDQTSLDVQATTGAALWKFEGLTNKGIADRFNAFIVGIEYTLFTLLGSDLDLGLLAEYNYDDRDNFQIVAFQDDGFVGARLAFNDVQDTQLLGGVIKDFDVSSTLSFIEGSRRLGDRWRVEVEYRGFHRINPDDVLQFLQRDSFIQVDVARFF